MSDGTGDAPDEESKLSRTIRTAKAILNGTFRSRHLYRPRED